MLTAHGGALGTGRNTRRYFDTIAAWPMEAIEVDIQKGRGKLYLAHILPKLSLKKAILMEDVFAFCLKYGKKVNCDTKQRGLAEEIVSLAESMGAADRIYFTGSFSADEVPALRSGAIAYVNTHFFRHIGTSPEKLDEVKRYLDSFGNPGLKGVNVSYRIATDAFLQKANEVGLGVSVYTVDREDELIRVLRHRPDNVTTNRIDLALRLREEREGGSAI